MRRLTDILKAIDTQPLVDRILEEYHKQGYNGEFAKKLACKLVEETKFRFSTAYYGYFMLYGRGATRKNYQKGETTLFDAIKVWCSKKGIPEQFAYPITKKIHKFGTKGNDFLTPIIPKLCVLIQEELYKEIKKNGIIN